MTSAEYFSKYGIKLADLRQWIATYAKMKSETERIARWKRALKEMEENAK